MILKSLHRCLACLVSQEQEKAAALLLAFLSSDCLAGGSQVYLVDGRVRASGSSNVLQRATLESRASFLCSLRCSSNGATRRLPGQKEGTRQGRVCRTQEASEVGLTHVMIRHR